MRFLLHLRAARIAEAQELRGLVEGLADGVVDRGADPHIVADAEHRDDLRMSAGGQEQAIGERRVVGEARGQRVRLEMIDRDQRLLGDQRDRLGGGEPDDDAADQPGPGGDRDAVELAERQPGIVHRLGDDHVERLDMGARRDLRHHAAEGRVLVDLRQHDIGQNLARPGLEPLDHRRRGLVAGRLDAEHNHPGSLSNARSSFSGRAGVPMIARSLPASSGVALRGHGVQSSGAATILRIGTRGSPLALAQARQVREALAAAHGFSAERIELAIIRTTGDAIQDRPLAEAGGKGLFTKEIEEALIAGAIDIAVHSAKDMPTLLPDGLAIVAALAREDPRDVFISRKAKTLRELPAGAVIGTASLRRQALAKRLRPDLAVVSFRGNVETRLRKLDEGVVDATLLALAGLKRLGLADAATAVLSVDEFLPAVGQGIIAIEARADDDATRTLLAPLNHAESAAALAAERAFLAVLDGSCRTPIAGHATIADGRVRFRGLIAKPDGSELFETAREGAAADAVRLAEDAARELKQRGGADFFVQA